MLELRLPYPPSVNTYWRRVGNRTLLSRRGRAYRREVGEALRYLVSEPVKGALEVQARLFPPDRRRRDLDNVAKALLDALEHAGVYRDDYQVRRLLLERGAPIPGGKAEVCVARLDD